MIAAMLARLRRRLSRRATMTPLEAHWALNHRVEHLYQLHREAEHRFADEMAAAVAGYLGDFRRRADALERHMEDIRLAGRAHTEAATSAALESAIHAAHEHTNAAVAAAITTVTENARAHAEAASESAERSALAGAQAHSEALSNNLRAELLEELAIVRRSIDLARRSAAPRAATSAPVPQRRDPDESEVDVEPAFYVALEDRFRGSQETIAEQQRRYIEHVQAVVDDAHPLLDLGCGRGEFLRTLQDAGLNARGVDSNPVAVAECLEAGLKVDEADLMTSLTGTADRSLGAVSMLQVVEHLPFGVLMQVFRECARVLRPGGLLLIETPNSLNVQVAATTFWLDPTHQRPLHPELLRLIAKESGFARSEGLFMNRLGDPTDTSGIDDRTAAILQRLVELFDGPGDFVLLAWTPRGS
jgi:SAM-dependent methyltransferase